MSIPPEPVLLAARRWLEVLPEAGTARCRALFLNHRDYSDLTPTQYESAYTWLRAAGLLENLQDPISASHRIYEAAVTTPGAAWLRDADALVRSPEELPVDAVAAAEALGIGGAEAFAHIQSAWRKVDIAERARIGLAGEQIVVEMLRQLGNVVVEHVSTWSDAFGYDVSFTAGEVVSHLEVKATVRRGQAVIYLSRHEAETMHRDPVWSLILVHFSASLRPLQVSTVPSSWLAAQMPTDCTMFGRWESCKIIVPPDVLMGGVASAASLAQGAASPLVTGFFPGGVEGS